MKKGYIEEEREQVIKELLRSKQVKPGQFINYEEFLELYELYKDKMKESEFADLLDIGYTNWQHIKCHSDRRTKALKGMIKELTKEEKEKILGEILQSNQIKIGQYITYKEFLKLYEPYKERIKEPDFASLLEITYSNWQNMRNRNRKIKILKRMIKKTTEEEKEKIIGEVLKNNQVKHEQSINYEEFLKLYEPYKDRINESNFADLLGITYNSWQNMRNSGRRAKVLKSKVKELTDEKKEEIINEILQNEQIKPGQLINYEEFLKLYEPYKDKMEETDFASILGLNYNNWQSMRNMGGRAKILKDMLKEVTEEEKEQIINEILQNEQIKPGQLVNYDDLLKLYEPYKNKMKESDFADLLGITYYNWQTIKYHRVQNNNIKEYDKRTDRRRKRKNISRNI